eukprot:g81007.t1
MIITKKYTHQGRFLVSRPAIINMNSQLRPRLSASRLYQSHFEFLRKNLRSHTSSEFLRVSHNFSAFLSISQKKIPHKHFRQYFEDKFDCEKDSSEKVSVPSQPVSISAISDLVMQGQA